MPVNFYPPPLPLIIVTTTLPPAATSSGVSAATSSRCANLAQHFDGCHVTMACHLALVITLPCCVTPPHPTSPTMWPYAVTVSGCYVNTAHELGIPPPLPQRASPIPPQCVSPYACQSHCAVQPFLQRCDCAEPLYPTTLCSSPHLYHYWVMVI